MQNRRHNTFGYSLIEMLAVIGIITVVLSIGFPVLKGQGQKRVLSQAAYKVKQSIEKTRIEANAPGVDVVDPTSTNGFQIVFPVGQTPPTTLSFCYAVFDNYFAGSCDREQYRLPGRVIVTDVLQWNGTDNGVSIVDAGKTLEGSGLQFEIAKNGIRIIKKLSGESGVVIVPSESQLIIRLESLDTNETKDVVVHTLTGVVYVK